MQNIILSKTHVSSKYLSEIANCLDLSQFLALYNFLQISVRTVFHNNILIIFRFISIVNIDNIWMNPLQSEHSLHLVIEQS